MCKKILGVDNSTSNLAALVRMGWLPLGYALAYRAAIWYMKILLGKAGNSLLRQYRRITHPSQNEIWGKTSFYKSCYDLISRLIKYMPDQTDFWNITEIKDIKRLLLNSMYAELSVVWNSCDHALFCHNIHPQWKKLTWKRKCFSRRGSSLYHQIAVDRGKLNYINKYSRNRYKNEKCRFGSII